MPWSGEAGSGSRGGRGEAHTVGEGLGHSPVSGVEAGVGVEECNAGTDEAVNGAALGIGGRNVVGPAQIERVVGDDHVDIGVDGLVDDGSYRVDGQQDASHWVGGISADEPVGVPRRCQAGRRSRLHKGDDVANRQGALRGAPGGLTSGLRGCGCRGVTHTTRLAARPGIPKT